MLVSWYYLHLVLQANVMYYVRRVVQYILPGLLPLSPTEAAADSAPLMQLLQGIFQLNSSLLFWLAWLLFPGLHSAYYTLFFASQAPIKTLYGVLIGKSWAACKSLNYWVGLILLFSGLHSACCTSFVRYKHLSLCCNYYAL